MRLNIGHELGINMAGLWEIVVQNHNTAWSAKAGRRCYLGLGIICRADIALDLSQPDGQITQRIGLA